MITPMTPLFTGNQQADGQNLEDFASKMQQSQMRMTADQMSQQLVNTQNGNMVGRTNAAKDITTKVQL